MVDSHGKTGLRGLDAQVVFLLGAEVLASMRWKQAPHVGGSITV